MFGDAPLDVRAPPAGRTRSNFATAVTTAPADGHYFGPERGRQTRCCCVVRWTGAQPPEKQASVHHPTDAGNGCDADRPKPCAAAGPFSSDRRSLGGSGVEGSEGPLFVSVRLRRPRAKHARGYAIAPVGGPAVAALPAARRRGFVRRSRVRQTRRPSQVCENW